MHIHTHTHPPTHPHTHTHTRLMYIGRKRWLYIGHSTHMMKSRKRAEGVQSKHWVNAVFLKYGQSGCQHSLLCRSLGYIGAVQASFAKIPTTQSDLPTSRAECASWPHKMPPMQKPVAISGSMLFITWDIHEMYEETFESFGTEVSTKNRRKTTNPRPKHKTKPPVPCGVPA